MAKIYEHNVRLEADDAVKDTAIKFCLSEGAIHIFGSRAVTCREATEIEDCVGKFDLAMNLEDGKTITVDYEAKWGRTRCRSGWGPQFAKPDNPFPFMYSTVDFPYRKEDSISDYNISISYLSDFLFIAETSVVHNSKILNKYTDNVGYDKFFAVPNENGHFFTISQDEFSLWTRKEYDDHIARYLKGTNV